MDTKSFCTSVQYVQIPIILQTTLLVLLCCQHICMIVMRIILDLPLPVSKNLKYP